MLALHVPAQQFLLVVPVTASEFGVPAVATLDWLDGLANVVVLMKDVVSQLRVVKKMGRG